MCHHSYHAAIYKSEKPDLSNLKASMQRQSSGVADSLKWGNELTILASCLGDWLSGLEDMGRDAVFSSYSLLLEESEKQKEKCVKLM